MINLYQKTWTEINNEIAKKIGLNISMARKTALDIRDGVNEMLREYLESSTAGLVKG